MVLQRSAEDAHRRGGSRLVEMPRGLLGCVAWARARAGSRGRHTPWTPPASGTLNGSVTPYLRPAAMLDRLDGAIWDHRSPL